MNDESCQEEITSRSWWTGEEITDIHNSCNVLKGIWDSEIFAVFLQFQSSEWPQGHLYYRWLSYLLYISNVSLMLHNRDEDKRRDYFIPTPFFWCSPHKRPIVWVPDKTAKVFTSLSTSPLLLQGGHNELLCWPRSKTDLSPCPQSIYKLYFLSLVPPQRVWAPFRCVSFSTVKAKTHLLNVAPECDVCIISYL